MIRTQAQLTEAQMHSLHRLAAERGVSVAALIREGVERVLADGNRPDPRARARAVVGAFGSGSTDVSVEHDRYLAEAPAD